MEKGKEQTMARYKRNPDVAPITQPLNAVKAGFNKGLVVQGLAILAGNFLTRKLSNMVVNRVGYLQGVGAANKAASVAVVLATAGVVGGVTKAVLPKFSSDVFVGGVLTGVSDALAALIPGQFGGSNKMLAEEFSPDALDGLADNLMIGQAMSPVGVSGFGDMGDNLMIGQAMSPVGVSELGEELGFDMM